MKTGKYTTHPTRFFINLSVPAQPTETSCGPTCLHGLYQFYGTHIDIEQLIREIPELPTGGTLGVLLGIDALKRGYQATLYTYNLRVFDPTWFEDSSQCDLVSLLRTELNLVDGKKLKAAIQTYIQFVEHGGKILFRDLTDEMLQKILSADGPVITGLSATFLYRTAREIPETNKPDSLKGLPVGHFVVLSGYDKKNRTVTVADPLEPNPLDPARHYSVDIDRLVNAILLGVLTYDGNILHIAPG